MMLGARNFIPAHQWDKNFARNKINPDYYVSGYLHDEISPHVQQQSWKGWLYGVTAFYALADSIDAP